MNMQPNILLGHPVQRSDENCACAVTLPSLEVAPIAADTGSKWRIAPTLFRTALPDAHQLIFPFSGSANVVVLNFPAQCILNAFAQPRHLGDLQYIVDIPVDVSTAAAGQLAALGLLVSEDENIRPNSQSDTLTAWLHVTNACNLRCTYCYIDKTDEAMDEATGRAAVAGVFRSAVQNGFRAIKLKYAGGEATLNFGLVQSLHQHALDLVDSTGLRLHEVVLSNGVALTRAMLDFMRAAGMRLMISLDGIGEVHDQQRVFANGRGSFKHVERSVDRAIAAGILPDLSITVTGRNANALAGVVDFAIDRGLRFNVNFFRENDCVKSSDGLKTDEARLIAGLRSTFEVIEEKLPRYRLIDGLLDRSSFSAPHEYGCGAGHASLVIDHNGGVARCQMEIEQPITSIVHEDPLSVIQLHPKGFQNVRVDEKEGCRDCQWRYWCAGGCSLLTYRTTGRSDVKSPYCNVYKAVFPDLLRLEGLRLLKWGSD